MWMTVDTKKVWQVLIIEDDDRLRTTLKKLLEQEGFMVQDAEEGNSGLALFKKTPADLVITDLIMPGKEGMETIIDIRKTNKDVKIIAISGGGRVRAAEYLPVAEIAGADMTLAKPFSFNQLLGKVNKLLDG